jgi:hypothetical protein
MGNKSWLTPWLALLKMHLPATSIACHSIVAFRRILPPSHPIDYRRKYWMILAFERQKEAKSWKKFDYYLR